MANKVTFEQSLEQLEQSVEALEQGSLTLDQALVNFEQGVKHAARCQQLLTKAENKVDLLLKGKNGALFLEQFEHEDGSS